MNQLVNDYIYLQILFMRLWHKSNVLSKKELDPEAVTGIRHAAVEKTTLTNIVFFVHKDYNNMIKNNHPNSE